MSQSSNTTRTKRSIEDAITAFRNGNPVLIHDAADREGEVDLVYPAEAVSPVDVARMRNDAGGLICVALPDSIAEEWRLPFLHDALDHPTASGHDLGYDHRSSFSLTVNHRDTYTGITDNDRARTISEIGTAAKAPGTVQFDAEFRSPGHVHLLRAAPALLEEREGHTELGLALADAANIAPAVVVSEMLDDETGMALTPPAARAYADRHDLSYLEGASLLERFG
ncbi:MAG: 3,4-dihydroxy-2-butanone-4-phosphate synthase [Natronomonas sp.]